MAACALSYRLHDGRARTDRERLRRAILGMPGVRGTSHLASLERVLEELLALPTLEERPDSISDDPIEIENHVAEDDLKPWDFEASMKALILWAKQVCHTYSVVAAAAAAAAAASHIPRLKCQTSLSSIMIQIASLLELTAVAVAVAHVLLCLVLCAPHRFPAYREHTQQQRRW